MTAPSPDRGTPWQERGATSADRGKDLYELLEVSANARPEVIQAAYKVLARTWHPDVSKDPAAEQRIRDLNGAYHVLSDAERRATYDLQRARNRRRERLTTPYEHPVRPVTSLVVRGGRADVQAARQRATRASTSDRLPVLSGQAIALVAAVAALVTVIVLLVWFGLMWSDEPQFMDRGPVIEMHSDGGR
jgi:hypothetical protein